MECPESLRLRILEKKSSWQEEHGRDFEEEITLLGNK